MNKCDYFPLKYVDNNLVFLDQTLLPTEEKYVSTDSYERVAQAIEKLEIRGAPAIGIAAAYGLALSQKEKTDIGLFDRAFLRLLSTRPTAVNLAWALNQLKECFTNLNKDESIYTDLLDKALLLHKEDEEMCRKIGENGLVLFDKKMIVLTHCNTGKLATGGDGTAFSIIKLAYENSLVDYVYADETRPLLQGSRLTAFELQKNGIPFSVLPDSAAASLFNSNKINIVITGADRIAKNGDTANKIGTYNLAVLAHHHQVPFYIAAPSSTIDANTLCGKDIPIEQRDREEVIGIFPNNDLTKNINVYNPSFDVTPAKLITGIITEKTIFKFPYSF